MKGNTFSIMAVSDEQLKDRDALFPCGINPCVSLKKDVIVRDNDLQKCVNLLE